MDKKLPKVSGILPVGYGSKYFHVAAAAFLASTYQGPLELVIVDNNDAPIEDLIPDDKRVKYFRCKKMAVGALRNLGTSKATGEIIMTVDEDDWSGPERVTEQVKRLQETGKAVTGYHSVLYYDVSTTNTYCYHYEPNRPHPPYACGSSQCYTKAWWTKHPFPEVGVEDYAFAFEALENSQLDSCAGEKLLVARAHGDSMCPANQLGRHRQFPTVDRNELPPEFYAAIAKAAPKPKSKVSKVTQEKPPCPAPQSSVSEQHSNLAPQPAPQSLPPSVE